VFHGLEQSGTSENRERPPVGNEVESSVHRGSEASSDRSDQVWGSIMSGRRKTVLAVLAMAALAGGIAESASRRRRVDVARRQRMGAVDGL
jgi:hypothetical protein